MINLTAIIEELDNLSSAINQITIEDLNSLVGKEILLLELSKISFTEISNKVFVFYIFDHEICFISFIVKFTGRGVYFEEDHLVLHKKNFTPISSVDEKCFIFRNLRYRKVTTRILERILVLKDFYSNLDLSLVSPPVDGITVLHRLPSTIELEEPLTMHNETFPAACGQIITQIIAWQEIDKKKTQPSADQKLFSDIKYKEQLKLFDKFDILTREINKDKDKLQEEINNYISDIRKPYILEKEKITLLALLIYFQKKYVYDNFIINLKELSERSPVNLELDQVHISTSPSSFPHLIGIKAQGINTNGDSSKMKTKEFLRGIYYQWISLSSHDGYEIDVSKLETFPWIHQTLRHPSFIYLKDGINNKKTNIEADLVFVSKINDNSKYAYHTVWLRKVDNAFVIVSQFGITNKRKNRIYEFFKKRKAVYTGNQV